MKRLVQFAGALLLTMICHTASVQAQGMPIDSLTARLNANFTLAMISQLSQLIPDYENQRVWGLAVGDFSNDSLPDLGISLYDLKGTPNRVTIYLFQNIGSDRFRKMMERTVPYVESPIEVGLLAESSVLTIIQKMGDEHWYQEGYSIEDGDVVLVDHFETQQQDIPAQGGHSEAAHASAHTSQSPGQASAGAHPAAKSRQIGHEFYCNYETLLSKETFFAAATGEQMFGAKYYTFPSYRRLKNVYPGYGYGMSDTSTDFITEGLGLRKGADDLSIRDAVTSYDDDYLYFSISVRDDHIVGNTSKDDSNDKVSLWFDTNSKSDRRIKNRKGGFPEFRNTLDSSIYNLTIVLPPAPGRVTRLLYSSQAPLTHDQKDAMAAVKAIVTFDTSSLGMIAGYTMRVRIPFMFLGLQSNPVNAYERGGPEGVSPSFDSDDVPVASGLGRSDLEDGPSFGFTAVVYDIDDPVYPNEVKVQATSNFKANDPSTFGTLILEPSTKFYGEVLPAYVETVKEGLSKAGF